MNKSTIRSQFFKYIFFNIISTLGISVYILIDTFFIAKGMGADGLAALNLCLPVFNFINGFGLMLGIGGGSKFSMLYGHVERRETDRVYSNAFYAALLISVLFQLTGLFFSGQVTTWLGADSTVFDMAHSYLRTVLLFAPAFILNQLILCFMRNDCAPKLAMAGVLGSSAANVVLDYLFIFRFGMGMKGAALATCISPFISLAIMGIHFATGWNAFHLRFDLASWDSLSSILSLGLYSLLTELSGGIVILVFNFVIYRMLGNTGIAAYGIIANLAIVFTAIFTGLSGGVQPLMCKLRGERDETGMRYLVRISVVTALLLAVGAYTAICMKTGTLVTLFNDSGNAQLQAFAEHGLRLYFIFLPFMGLNSIFVVYFTACELPTAAQLVSLLRGALLVVPLAFIFFAFRSVNGIWLTIPIAEVLTLGVSSVICFYIAKPYETYVYYYQPPEPTVHSRPNQYF